MRLGEMKVGTISYAIMPSRNQQKTGTNMYTKTLRLHKETSIKQGLVTYKYV